MTTATTTVPSPNSLKLYWNTHFPLAELCALWGLHNKRLENRELAFRARKIDGSVFFKRYVSVESSKKLKTEMQRLHLLELHVGGIFNRQCSLARTLTVDCRVVGREFVLDFDAQDRLLFRVDDKENVTANDRQLKVVLLGVNIARAALRELFGFQNFLVSYSGRRGVHLTVLDPRAFVLSSDARSAILSRLSVPVSNKTHSKNLLYAEPVLDDPSFGAQTHAAMKVAEKQLLKTKESGGFGLLSFKKRRLDFLDELFRPVIHGQNTPSNVGLMQRTNDVVWRAMHDGEKMLAEMRKAVCGQFVSGGEPIDKRLEQMLFTLYWPIIDKGASRSGHLLKAEFSPHNSTGRIAIPFVLDELLPVWDPSTCPTVEAVVGGDPDAFRAFEAGKKVMRDAVAAVGRSENKRKRKDELSW